MRRCHMCQSTTVITFTPDDDKVKMTNCLSLTVCDGRVCYHTYIYLAMAIVSVWFCHHGPNWSSFCFHLMMEALPDFITKQANEHVQYVCKLQEYLTFPAESWHETSACHTSVPAYEWWPHNLLNLLSEPPHFSWTPQLQFYFSHIFCNKHKKEFSLNKIYYFPCSWRLHILHLKYEYQFQSIKVTEISTRWLLANKWQVQQEGYHHSSYGTCLRCQLFQRSPPFPM